MAARTPTLVGSPWAFVGAVALTVLWLLSGPLFHWSDNWILVPATATSIGAFLLVLLLQYSQNRDTRAIQLKLDELIRSLGDARTHLVRLEQMSDEELERIERDLQRVGDDARRAASG